MSSSRTATFFKLVYQQNTGLVCLARIDRNHGRAYHEKFFQYPKQLHDMVEFVDEFSRTDDLYYCPQLFDSPHRKKEHVKHAPTVYADLDFCSPDRLQIKPSLIIQSSPSRYQALWILDGDYPPLQVENAAKRLAYGHKDDGCDISGWDLTQLLRIPFTFNFKYQGELNIPMVQVSHASQDTHTLDAFSVYPSVEHFDKILSLPMPVDFGIADELMEKYGDLITQQAKSYYELTPVGSWSEALWELETSLCAAGVDVREVFTICKKAACNKYARDGRPDAHLWAEILKAKVMTSPVAAQQRDLKTNAPLLTKKEREYLRNSPDTFVDKYIRWATEISDAARQYHQAGAFTILSALCAGGVKLPTSFGNVYPNMWFMILGDTTITRKSTSMDIAKELLDDVYPEAVVATDGSVEGLMSVMATRSGKSSIFMRDEFSGLVEAMIKKDYMAGAAEMFTKLYDGKSQKRILKKEVIDIRDPRLIIYAGGIKNKVTDTLTEEHVSSGFMPRFVYITAVSDPTKIKPVGPPTASTVTGRNELIRHMKTVYTKYNGYKPIVINNIPQPGLPVKVEYEAHMSQQVWDRYNELERRLVAVGINADRKELFTPVGDRLAKSILKAAVLLACDRERSSVTTKPQVEVTMYDMLNAIKYGESWLKYAFEVISNVGNNEVERRLIKIKNYIEAAPAPVSRSKVMSAFKLTSFEAGNIFKTLVDRGDIMQMAAGKSVKYGKVE